MYKRKIWRNTRSRFLKGNRKKMGENKVSSGACSTIKGPVI